jgi:hypothetical protein
MQHTSPIPEELSQLPYRLVLIELNDPMGSMQSNPYLVRLLRNGINLLVGGDRLEVREWLNEFVVLCGQEVMHNAYHFDVYSPHEPGYVSDYLFQSRECLLVRNAKLSGELKVTPFCPGTKHGREGIRSDLCKHGYSRICPSLFPNVVAVLRFF